MHSGDRVIRMGICTFTLLVPGALPCTAVSKVIGCLDHSIDHGGVHRYYVVFTTKLLLFFFLLCSLFRCGYICDIYVDTDQQGINAIGAHCKEQSAALVLKQGLW